MRLLSLSPPASYTPAAGAERPRGRQMKGNKSVTAAVAMMALGALVVGLASLPAVAQRKKITLDELVIEGNIQKPQAFFILPRTSLNFEDLERREDLKSRIVKSVEKAPF